MLQSIRLRPKAELLPLMKIFFGARSLFHQTQQEHDHHPMFAQIDPDLLEGLGDMVAYGVFGNLQPVGDLCVGKTLFADQLVDFSPLGRQVVDSFPEQSVYLAEILLIIGMVGGGRQPAGSIILKFDVAGIPFDIVKGPIGRHMIKIGRRLFDRR